MIGSIEHAKIISLTARGQDIAERIKQYLEPTAHCVHKPTPFSSTIQSYFLKKHPLIFICATGIVVRTLASVLESKYQDPPVLVIDEAGQFVIALLSGHEGGANQWALDIAHYLDAQAVITSANDYCNPVYTVGMGCERHCSQHELDALLIECLDNSGLRIDQIHSINSIDLKADEVGLIELCQRYSKPFLTWSKDELAVMESKLSTRSDYVFNAVGVYGVAEAAALVGAQQLVDGDVELILNKHKSKKATCAISRAYSGKAL
jgi:cobalt-precorrin 5A hydrolase